jgi:hypothetical protein
LQSGSVPLALAIAKPLRQWLFGLARLDWRPGFNRSQQSMHSITTMASDRGADASGRSCQQDGFPGQSEARRNAHEVSSQNYTMLHRLKGAPTSLPS